MTFPTFIDKIQIGVIEFTAFIIEDENSLEAFAIYFQDKNTPLLMFQQDIPRERVEIKINTELVEELQLLKSKDFEQRKEHFKTFQDFALNAEQKAKEIAFQDKRLNYISDIQLIKGIEKAYLLD